jgi:lysophospholipase L1-like esterase
MMLEFLSQLSAHGTPFRSGDRIVCFGDSITRFGNGPTGYVGLLRAAFTAPGAPRVSVYNAGIGGDSTELLQTRVAADVLARHPNIVFISVGLNDAGYFFDWSDAQTPVRYATALRDVIARIQAEGAVVVLATPTVFGEQQWGTNEFDAQIDTCVALNRQVAREMHVHLCEMHTLFRDYLSMHNSDNKESGILTVDKVHLSDLGNVLFAEEVAQCLFTALQSVGSTPYVPGSRFLDSDEVTIIVRAPLAAGAGIRFTTDGTEPGPQSPGYQQPFPVTATTTVKARVFAGQLPVSPTVSGTYTRLTLRAPDNPGAVVSGLRYQYFAGDWPHIPIAGTLSPVEVQIQRVPQAAAWCLPDLSMLTPVATGTVATFEWSPRQQTFNYALRFSGYLQVETLGIYTFYTDSGDGSRLTIGDTVVVDNDGIHPPGERDGQIALQPGLHAICVDYMKYIDEPGNAWFEVSIAGPNGQRQTIPASMLFHTETPDAEESSFKHASTEFARYSRVAAGTTECDVLNEADQCMERSLDMTLNKCVY